MFRSKSLLRCAQTLINNQLVNKTNGPRPRKSVKSNERNEIKKRENQNFLFENNVSVERTRSADATTFGRFDGRNSKSQDLLSKIQNGINNRLFNKKSRSLSCSELTGVARKNIIHVSRSCSNSRSENTFNYINNNQNSLSKFIKNQKTVTDETKYSQTKNFNFNSATGKNHTSNKKHNVNPNDFEVNTNEITICNSKQNFSRINKHSLEDGTQECSLSLANVSDLYKPAREATKTVSEDFKGIHVIPQDDNFTAGIATNYTLQNHYTHSCYENTVFKQVTNNTIQIISKEAIKKFKGNEKYTSIFKKKLINPSTKINCSKNIKLSRTKKYPNKSVQAEFFTKIKNELQNITRLENTVSEHNNLQKENVIWKHDKMTNLIKKNMPLDTYRQCNKIPRSEHFSEIDESDNSLYGTNEIETERKKICFKNIAQSNNRSNIWQIKPAAMGGNILSYEVINRKVNKPLRYQSQKSITTIYHTTTSKLKVEEHETIKINKNQDSLRDDTTNITSTSTQDDFHPSLRRDSSMYFDKSIEDDEITSSNEKDQPPLNELQFSDSLHSENTEKDKRKTRSLKSNKKCVLTSIYTTPTEIMSDDRYVITQLNQKNYEIPKEEKILGSIYNGKNQLYKHTFTKNKKQENNLDDTEKSEIVNTIKNQKELENVNVNEVNNNNVRRKYSSAAKITEDIDENLLKKGNSTRKVLEATAWEMGKHYPQMNGRISYVCNKEINDEALTLNDAEEKMQAVAWMKSKQYAQMRGKIFFKHSNEIDQTEFFSNDTEKKTNEVAWIKGQQNHIRKRSCRTRWVTDDEIKQKEQEEDILSITANNKDTKKSNSLSYHFDKNNKNSTTSATAGTRNKTYKSDNNLLNHFHDKKSIEKNNKNYSQTAFENKKQTETKPLNCSQIETNNDSVIKLNSQLVTQQHNKSHTTDNIVPLHTQNTNFIKNTETMDVKLSTGNLKTTNETKINKTFNKKYNQNSAIPWVRKQNTPNNVINYRSLNETKLKLNNGTICHKQNLVQIGEQKTNEETQDFETTFNNFYKTKQVIAANRIDNRPAYKDSTIYSYKIITRSHSEQSNAKDNTHSPGACEKEMYKTLNNSETSEKNNRETQPQLTVLWSKDDKRSNRDNKPELTKCDKGLNIKTGSESLLANASKQLNETHLNKTSSVTNFKKSFSEIAWVKGKQIRNDSKCSLNCTEDATKLIKNNILHTQQKDNEQKNVLEVKSFKYPITKSLINKMNTAVAWERKQTDQQPTTQFYNNKHNKKKITSSQNLSKNNSNEEKRFYNNEHTKKKINTSQNLSKNDSNEEKRCLDTHSEGKNKFAYYATRTSSATSPLSQTASEAITDKLSVNTHGEGQSDEIKPLTTLTKSNTMTNIKLALSNDVQLDKQIKEAENNPISKNNKIIDCESVKTDDTNDDKHENTVSSQMKNQEERSKQQFCIANASEYIRKEQKYKQKTETNNLVEENKQELNSEQKTTNESDKICTVRPKLQQTSFGNEEKSTQKNKIKNEHAQKSNKTEKYINVDQKEQSNNHKEEANFIKEVNNNNNTNTNLQKTATESTKNILKQLPKFDKNKGSLINQEINTEIREDVNLTNILIEQTKLEDIELIHNNNLTCELHDENRINPYEHLSQRIHDEEINNEENCINETYHSKKNMFDQNRKELREPTEMKNNESHDINMKETNGSIHKIVHNAGGTFHSKTESSDKLNRKSPLMFHKEKCIKDKETEVESEKEYKNSEYTAEFLKNKIDSKTHAERMADFYEFEEKLLGFTRPLHQETIQEMYESSRIMTELNKVQASILSSKNTSEGKIEKNLTANDNNTGPAMVELNETLQEQTQQIQDSTCAKDSETLKAFKNKKKEFSKAKDASSLHIAKQSKTIQNQGSTKEMPVKKENLTDPSNIIKNKNEATRTAEIPIQEKQSKGENTLTETLSTATKDYASLRTTEDSITDFDEDNAENKTKSQMAKLHSKNDLILNKVTEETQDISEKSRETTCHDFKEKIINQEVINKKTEQIIPNEEKYNHLSNNQVTLTEESKTPEIMAIPVQKEDSATAIQVNKLTKENKNYNFKSKADNKITAEKNKNEKEYTKNNDEKVDDCTLMSEEKHKNLENETKEKEGNMQNESNSNIDVLSEQQNSTLNVNMLKEIYDSQIKEIMGDLSHTDSVSTSKNNENRTSSKMESDFYLDCAEILQSDHMTICVPKKTLSAKSVIINNKETNAEKCTNSSPPILKTMLNAVIYTIFKDDNLQTESEGSSEKEIKSNKTCASEKTPQTNETSDAANEIKSENTHKNPFVMLINDEKYPMINKKKLILKYPTSSKTKIITHTDKMVYKHVPSVSKILNETIPQATKADLRKWELNYQISLGKAQFEEFYREQLKNDIQFHDCIRRYMLGTPLSILKENADRRMKGSLKSLQGILPKLENITALESPVVHPELPYHGIVDCVACYNDVPVIIEWKQADKPKPASELSYDAPVQLSAYIGAINFDHNYELPIKSGMVVIAYTDGSPADIISLTPESCQKYWKMWLERLQKYLAVKN